MDFTTTKKKRFDNIQLFIKMDIAVNGPFWFLLERIPELHINNLRRIDQDDYFSFMRGRPKLEQIIIKKCVYDIKEIDSISGDICGYRITVFQHLFEKGYLKSNIYRVRLSLFHEFENLYEASTDVKINCGNDPAPILRVLVRNLSTKLYTYDFN